jgi:methylated-DNA-protein-cysteine methyltransferase related protein
VNAPPGWSRYYRIVSRIPRGRVTTYGDVALLAGNPRGARHVGFALSALRGAKHRVPWQRVLGKRPGDYAGISLLDPMGAAVQQAKLEREGVRFDERGRVSLAEFGWRARRPTPPAAGPPSRSPRRTGGWSGRS